MTTLIRSTLKGSKAVVEINGPGSEKPADGDVAFLLDLLDGRGFEFHLPAAGLLATLDAVPRAELEKLPVTAEDYNRAITELHARISRAHCGKDYWKKKAEDLKAELAESKDAATIRILRAEIEELNNNPWKGRFQLARNRAERAETERDEARELATQRHEANSAIIAQLNEAEAERDRLRGIVDAVRAVREEWIKTYGCASHVKDIDAALNQLTLPTVAPATVVAVESDGTEHSFELWTDGKGGLSWVDSCDGDGGEDAYSPEELMRQFTGHRVIGADE